MPISIPINLKRLDQEEFKQLDYAVMGHAYQCQNALGRLCDEGIYQRDLADRLKSAGLGPIYIEFPIQVTHGDFVTTYSADLVVADSAIYELKIAATLIGEHKRQLLNYLLLCEQPRGKLVNFRTAGVESQFVNTQLTLDKRREFSVDTSRWVKLCDRCEMVARLLEDLLRDWGGFLETSLYLEAVTHFLGGEGDVLARIPVTRQGRLLGTQPVHLLSSDVVLRMTALTENQDEYEVHLQRMLSHSQLRGIQWVNFNHHVVEWQTLMKS